MVPKYARGSDRSATPTRTHTHTHKSTLQPHTLGSSEAATSTAVAVGSALGCSPATTTDPAAEKRRSKNTRAAAMRSVAESPKGPCARARHILFEIVFAFCVRF